MLLLILISDFWNYWAWSGYCVRKNIGVDIDLDINDINFFSRENVDIDLDIETEILENIDIEPKFDIEGAHIHNAIWP